MKLLWFFTLGLVTLTTTNARNIKIQIDPDDILKLVNGMMSSETIKNFATQLAQRGLSKRMGYINPYHPEDDLVNTFNDAVDAEKSNYENKIRQNTKPPIQELDPLDIENDRFVDENEVPSDDVLTENESEKHPGKQQNNKGHEIEPIRSGKEHNVHEKLPGLNGTAHHDQAKLPKQNDKQHHGPEKSPGRNNKEIHEHEKPPVRHDKIHHDHEKQPGRNNKGHFGHEKPPGREKYEKAVIVSPPKPIKAIHPVKLLNHASSLSPNLLKITASVESSDAARSFSSIANRTTVEAENKTVGIEVPLKQVMTRKDSRFIVYSDDRMNYKPVQKRFVLKGSNNEDSAK